jgi:hypothetical protein
MPIVFNEDNQPWLVTQQGWGESGNNFVAAVKGYASWGHFDFRRSRSTPTTTSASRACP